MWLYLILLALILFSFFVLIYVQSLIKNYELNIHLLIKQLDRLSVSEIPNYEWSLKDDVVEEYGLAILGYSYLAFKVDGKYDNNKSYILLMEKYNKYLKIRKYAFFIMIVFSFVLGILCIFNRSEFVQL